MFSAEAAGLIAGRLVRVLEQVAADPGLRVHQVSLLTDAERAELAARNETAVAGAGRHGGRVVCCAGAAGAGCGGGCGRGGGGVVPVPGGLRRPGWHRGWRRPGAGPESVVAVLVPRSAGMVTAVLGVLWAGAAYLPLDSGYPAGRIGFMLADARAVALVSTRQAAAALPAGPDGPPRVVLDDPGMAGRGGAWRVCAGAGGAGRGGVCDVHLWVDRDAQGRGGHSGRGGGAGV